MRNRPVRRSPFVTNDKTVSAGPDDEWPRYMSVSLSPRFVAVHLWCRIRGLVPGSFVFGFRDVDWPPLVAALWFTVILPFLGD